MSASVREDAHHAERDDHGGEMPITRTGRDFFEGRRIRGWGTDWLWVLPVLLGHGHRSGPILKEPNGSREYAFLF